jgi:hypothetical protein
MTRTASSTDRRINPLKIAKAVAWSFFGVRKSADHRDDVASLTLPQVIVAGIVGGAIVVTCFATIARLAAS